MIGLVALVLTASAFDPTVIEAAVQAEIDRGMAELRLPDQPQPHHITVRVGAGTYAEVWAGDGQLYSEEAGPYRLIRADVRVGDDVVDSGNFRAALGMSDGTNVRGLAHEDDVQAIRRELWLAMDGAYKGATETMAAKRAAREGRDLDYTPDFSTAPVVKLSAPTPTVADRDGLRARVLAVAEAIDGAADFESSGVGGQVGSGAELIQNSEGTVAWKTSDGLIIRADMVMAASDGARLRNVRSWVVRDLERLPDAADMIESAKDAARWLETMTQAPVSDDYLGPVLFEEAASAELFRQLLQPQVCGTPPLESAPEGSSTDARPVAISRIGRRLLPSRWSVQDTPQGNPELASFSTHDSDAVASQSVQLVEDGVLRDVLMSRVPRSDRQKSTGHGRGMGRDRVEAMPSQVKVEHSGSVSSRRLRRLAVKYAKQAGLPYVLVVRRLVPPSMADSFEFSVTGDEPLAGLTAPTEIYRLYADGREEPVRGLQFVGVDRRVLRDIVASARTSQVVEMLDVPGASRRFGLAWFEGFPVSWSVPEVLIGELELHSRSGGEPRVIGRPNP